METVVQYGICRIGGKQRTGLGTDGSLAFVRPGWVRDHD